MEDGSGQSTKEPRLSIRLVGFQPGASQDQAIAALRKLYRGKTDEDIRKALARLPIVLTRSVVEEQARKIQKLLEAQGAILEIAYEPAGATRGAAPAPRPSTGIPAATPPLRAPARPAPSTPARSAGLADFPPTPAREAPSTPMPSGVPGKPPGRERRAKPRLHSGIQLAP